MASKAPVLGTTKKVDLDDAAFGAEFRESLVHASVRAELAARRQGTHATKTRGNVRGGGAKPWRQKGTGRARQGSTRAPHWTGGGVAHGPRPRDYSQRTPKKMVALALRSALSDRARDDRIVVVDDLAFGTPKTKDALAALTALGVTAGERVLVVLGRDDEVAWKALRNLTHVDTLISDELNTFDVLCNDWLVFTSATLRAITDRLAAGTKRGDHGAVPVAVGGEDEE
jgi:large subunit ribosomal protein L4